MVNGDNIGSDLTGIGGGIVDVFATGDGPFEGLLNDDEAVDPLCVGGEYCALLLLLLLGIVVEEAVVVVVEAVVGFNGPRLLNEDDDEPCVNPGGGGGGGGGVDVVFVVVVLNPGFVGDSFLIVDTGEEEMVDEFVCTFEFELFVETLPNLAAA